jgi:hypothetical protein
MRVYISEMNDEDDRPPKPVIVNYSNLTAATYRHLQERSLPPSERDPDYVLSREDEALLGSILRDLEMVEGDLGVMTAPDSQEACVLQSYLAEHAEAHDQFAQEVHGTREAKFDNHDWRWVKTAIAEVRRRSGIEHRDKWPGIPDASDVTAIDGEIRAAVLGDWGTGTYGAVPIAESIRRAGDYQALIHLGDIYYSGTEKEIKNQFLPQWQDMMADNPGSVSRACNGNHEMYSGGGAYFEHVLGKLRQSTSMFAVRNAMWLLIGLDTAFDDSTISRDQAKWLRRVTSAHPDHKLVLFSHHQPFSALSGQGAKLVDAIDTVIDLDRIFAWYWGHEHLWASYDKTEEWPFHGRCNGHAGFPYFRPHELRQPGLKTQDLHRRNFSIKEIPGRTHADDDQPTSVPRAWILDGSNDEVGDHAARYGPNGYMRLLFRADGSIDEELHHSDGSTLWSNTLA